MNIFTFANNVSTTLAGPISSSATSLTLSSAAHLPTSIPTGKVLAITLNDVATEQNFEVIYATAISGATLSGLLRGQEGTAALSWSTGDFVYSAPTAGQQANFGQLPADNTWTGSNTFDEPILAQGGQLSGVIGDARNAKMSIAAASVSGTWSADEVVLESALGGLRYCVSNASATINLSTIGAGGMDTGSAPASGFVAVYAIYDPSASTFNLLATDATSSVAHNVYTGGHMPSGYTASALISVWPTNSSRQFIVGNQVGRRISFSAISILNTSVVAATFTSFTLFSIPLNAQSIEGFLSINNTSNSSMLLSVASDSSGTGQQAVSGYISLDSAITCNYKIDLSASRTLYYSATNQTGVAALNAYAVAYTF